MQAITIAVGDDIVKHAAIVDATIKGINAKLPSKTCFPTLTNVGLEQPTFVRLGGITQAAMMEVVLGYRNQGWKVDYGPDVDGTPMVTISISARG